VLAVPAASAAAAAAGGIAVLAGQLQQQQQQLLKLDASAHRDQLMHCSSKVRLSQCATAVAAVTSSHLSCSPLCVSRISLLCWTPFTACGTLYLCCSVASTCTQAVLFIVSCWMVANIAAGRASSNHCCCRAAAAATAAAAAG
jgi:hypothetical protein